MLRRQSTPRGARLSQLHRSLLFLRKIVSLGDVLQDPTRRLPLAPPQQSIYRAEKFGQRPHEPQEVWQTNHWLVRQPRLRSTREALFSFQFKLHQIVERDPPDDFQTFRADFVECVLGSVPRWKIEIDQIDHRNPALVKRRVIVGHSTTKIGEMSTLAERVGGSKNIASSRGRRIG